jgi:hypothetical protein
MSEHDSLAGNYPLRVLGYTGRTGNATSWTPRVEFVVGRDSISGGITIVAYLANGDNWGAPSRLFAHRWQDAPQTIEECLLVAYRGLLAYFEEAGILIP